MNKVKNYCYKLVDEVADPYNYLARRLGKKNGGFRIQKTNNKIPSRINITVGFGYDKSVVENLGNKSAIRTWLEEVFIHMTTYFQHPSLPTKIDLKVFILNYSRLFSNSF